ncbi:MAG: SDR family oxidoreductase [Oscillospiraceae bacterium]|nr:SDR family oxidoreductase [Oscillospiraceae bacterium]
MSITGHVEEQFFCQRRNRRIEAFGSAQYARFITHSRENQQPYCATKGGIQSLARALAFDWAKYGITVNVVAPTFALTEITRTRLEDPEYSKMVLGMIPVGRVVNPSEIGSAFAYLASDEASMVTGHTLVVDGGWTIW